MSREENLWILRDLEKPKLGATLRSKTPVAHRNDLLLKVLKESGLQG